MTLMQYMGIVWLFKHMKPTTSCWRVILSATQFIFYYEFDRSKHAYEPDFLIEGHLVEVKGDHFFKENGTMQNPYDHSQDSLYEAKHQCMVENGVEIWRANEYSKYVNYIEAKYGKDYLKKFKNK